MSRRDERGCKSCYVPKFPEDEISSVFERVFNFDREVASGVVILDGLLVL